jgi:hypothetical protein
MRAITGLIKDRHGTYCARHKVPLRLQEAVARVLDKGKPKQACEPPRVLRRPVGLSHAAKAGCSRLA